MMFQMYGMRLNWHWNLQRKMPVNFISVSPVIWSLLTQPVLAPHYRMHFMQFPVKHSDSWRNLPLQKPQEEVCCDCRYFTW